MEISTSDFFHDFRQELIIGAEANNSYQIAEFLETIANELMETGFIEGFEFCHFRAQRGMRVDGYWFNDEGVLTLFIADFENRIELFSLTQKEVETFFRRLENFYTASSNKKLFGSLEETTPEYGLARQIADRVNSIRQVNFFLISERKLSDRVQSITDKDINSVKSTYQIWDITRLQRQRSSRGYKEALDLDFREMFGAGLPCLKAHFGANHYESYLIVIPGGTLSSLYEKYGSRLLEQNVRTFLQARGKVNKGIRSTILNEPEMFFAYNNGITATAQEVEVENSGGSLVLIRVRDLQIVNGGQTTASLFHTKRKDKASLENVFVQMKLSIIDTNESENVIPLISEYSNTQNKVNAADFFSNHPFHIRIEEFSRRIWAPAQPGTQRETKWFYERARGQYADAQSKLTPAEKRKFKTGHPKSQMFTKTDLAKFENVWDDHPKWVNLGAQKNFTRYAERIGKEWEKSAVNFNEYYFKRIIVRAVIFRKTEKVVSEQPWYNGGYRANIVIYTIAILNNICNKKGKFININQIWEKQSLSPAFIETIINISRFVNDEITKTPPGISNISEWCKKEACWTRIESNIWMIEKNIHDDFWNEIVPIEDVKHEEKTAKKTQKVDDGINAQVKIVNIPGSTWSKILLFGKNKKLFSPKEIGVLEIAEQIPTKIPSEKQCYVLVEVIEKVKLEGFNLT